MQHAIARAGDAETATTRSRAPMTPGESFVTIRIVSGAVSAAAPVVPATKRRPYVVARGQLPARLRGHRAAALPVGRDVSSGWRVRFPPAERRSRATEF